MNTISVNPNIPYALIAHASSDPTKSRAIVAQNDTTAAKDTFDIGDGPQLRELRQRPLAPASSLLFPAVPVPAGAPHAWGATGGLAAARPLFTSLEQLVSALIGRLAAPAWDPALASSLFSIFETVDRTVASAPQFPGVPADAAQVLRRLADLPAAGNRIKNEVFAALANDGRLDEGELHALIARFIDDVKIGPGRCGTGPGSEPALSSEERATLHRYLFDSFDELLATPASDRPTNLSEVPSTPWPPLYYDLFGVQQMLAVLLGLADDQNALRRGRDLYGFPTMAAGRRA
ncbi:MAG: hypothetical protein HYV63_13105 [Candidatus Schekmanbacteria bacterium]|nr:hypothetical protein [Candidatus Schekmanbacteria bacterium]